MTFPGFLRINCSTEHGLWGVRKMIVRELIEILHKHDGNMTVLVEGYEYGLCDTEEENIKETRYFENHNRASFAGPHEPSAEGDHVGLVIGRGAHV